MRASATVASLIDRFYPTAASRDPILQFVEVLKRYVDPGKSVLDIGAGTGLTKRYAMRGHCKEIVGVDLDPRVAQNPLLDRGIVADARNLPLPRESFDTAFSIYVLEHIDDPAAFADQVRRVLKPGGHFLALVPNRFHYVAVAARLTPIWFHRWYNRLRTGRRTDVFPTFYQLNTEADLVRFFGQADFETVMLRGIEVQPHYLTMWAPAFLLGVAYERLVRSSERFRGWRANLICVFKKR